MIEWSLYLTAGAVAGIMAGLLGIGGGFVIVPAFLFLLPSSGIPEEVLMQVAVGTSLATICVTSLSSLRTHHQKGAVDWQYVRYLAPGVVIGAMLAGVIADFLPSNVLAIIFGVGGIVMAIQIWFSVTPSVSKEKPNQSFISLMATGIGCVSGLVGIGGGSLIVPYLHYLGERIGRCVGTAAACGLPIAVSGTLSFVVVGWDVSLPSPSLGYIYLPAFLGIIVTSSVTAPIGAKLAHKLPAKQLKRIFAVFLVVVGGRIIMKNLG